MPKNRIVEQARIGWASVDIQFSNLSKQLTLPSATNMKVSFDRHHDQHLLLLPVYVLACGVWANGITFVLNLYFLDDWRVNTISYLCVRVCVCVFYIYVYTCVPVGVYIPKHAQFLHSGQCHMSSCISLHIVFWDMNFHWTCSPPIGRHGWPVNLCL